jgi:CDP-glucose 4,6-dehydratase
MPSLAFWRGKRVLLTGHTGFKGGWLALWLRHLGADVTGFALPPEPGHSLFALAGVAQMIDSRFADLRDPDAIAQVVRDTRPEIVLHLAAQAYVRRSLVDPSATFATNVQGTIHLLDALRQAGGTSVCLCVTSDKVYRNDETGRPFSEGDPLGGKDPYSASKAACEIAVQSWRLSFALKSGMALATVRGGNVIGGGDFGENRLVPDCVRAFEAGKALVLRHPEATRPWQHVLDCLNGYLLFAEALGARHEGLPPALNIGPDSRAALPVGVVAERMMAALQAEGRPSPGVRVEPDRNSIEARMLALDTSMARQVLGWQDQRPGEAGLDATAAWYADWLDGADMAARTRTEIDAFAGQGAGVNPGARS